MAILAIVLFIRGESDHAKPEPGPIVTATQAGAAVSGNSNVVANSGGIVVGSGSTINLAATAEPARPVPPPKIGLCLGRDNEIATTIGAWLAGQSVVVLGGPGIGKSTVLRRSIGDTSIKQSFGDRRFVVSLEGADSVPLAIDKIAIATGVAIGEHLHNRVIAFLRSAPTVLVVDNFETLADSDPGGAADLLAVLGADSSPVVLGIGYRGAAIPADTTGMAHIPLGPLNSVQATDVFLTLAGDRHRTDSHLERLIADLDGVPLAVVLLATLARPARLDDLAMAWEAKRTDLLRVGARPDRTSSLAVSIELSWDRLSEDARTALALAALLPDGWPHGQATMYLPAELMAGIVELNGRALLYDDVRRQRCLTPIRQHVSTHHSLDGPYLADFTAKVGALALRSGQIGGPAGSAVSDELTPEFTNIVEVIRTQLPHKADLANAVSAMLDLQRFTGLGDYQLGHDALEAAKAPQVKATVARSLGRLYSRRSDNHRARELLDQALALYQRIGDVPGEANCLSSLGQVEFLESHNDLARDLFNQALPLYQRIDAILGEANCLHNLGHVEFHESRNDKARALYDQALPLYQRIGDVLGEANCLHNLGQVEFRESRDDLARDLFNQALPLYQRIGSVLGEANSLRNLGRVEFHESHNDLARDLFNQALPLYQRVGSLLGEANCLSDLGQVEFLESHNDLARDLFNQALPLYEQVRDRYSLALTHAWLTRVTEGDSRADHCGMMLKLAAELNINGFAEHLRSISGCS